MKKQNIEALRKIIRKEEPGQPLDRAKHATELKKATSAAEKMDAEITTPGLELVYTNKLFFRGKRNNYYVLGELPQDISNLKVTLQVEDMQSGSRERFKLDLYETAQVQECIRTLAARFHESEEVLQAELLMLTDLLEKHRDTRVIEQQTYIREKDNLRMMVPAEAKAAIQFLSSPNLMKRTFKLIEQAWATSDSNISNMVFVAMASYRNSTPLHLSLIGSPGNVKNFIDQLAKCLPPEDLLRLNDVSARTLYHCTNNQLVNKAVLLPHGLDKKAKQALNRLQQGDILSTATTVKDKLGNMVSALKEVKSHFSSITLDDGSGHGLNHVLYINMNETDKNVIDTILYENAVFSGKIDKEVEAKFQVALQNILRCIKSVEVINPFADKVRLHVQKNEILKMTRFFNALTKQVCLLHQFQREKDEQGRLIADIDDMRVAGRLLVNTVALEYQDLSPALKQLYEGIREYVCAIAEDQANSYEFTQREIREALNLSKNYCFRYMKELLRLEYIVKSSGYVNNGIKYRAPYIDTSKDVQRRKSIIENLEEQLAELSDGGLNRKAS